MVDTVSSILPFGIPSAPEHYKWQMSMELQDLSTSWTTFLFMEKLKLNMSHITDDKGVHPNPDRIKAIQ